MPNWDLKRWSEFLHYVGQCPVWVVAGTPHVWNQLIYAAEILRLHPEAQAEIDEGRHTGLAHRHPDAKPHREFKPGEVQTELGEGHSWGVDPVDFNKPIDRLEIDTKPLDHSKTAKPVREQIEERQAQKLVDDKSQAAPAEVHLTKEGPALAFEAKWIKAEEVARGSRKLWDKGQFDTDFEEMIRHCYGWLRDIGEVPQPYPDSELTLFWPRPHVDALRMTPTAVERRTFITGKVIKFLRKSMSQDGVKEQLQLKRQPPSYRVILSAKKLSTAIEYYVEPDPIHGEDDGELMDNVKRAAMRYFKAHFPVSTEGAKPGPITTLDPDYVGYIKLCRKYGLKDGTLLHKVDL